jgi:anti-anti-sigma factor
MAYRRCPTCWEKHRAHENVCIACGTSLTGAELFKEAGDDGDESRPRPIITARSAGRVTVLEFAGLFVEEAAAAQIRDCISRLLEQGRRQILVDVEGVPAMDRTCIGELVKAYTKVASSGGSLKLVNVTKRSGPFGLHGTATLLTVFECFQSESDALLSFQEPEE